MKEIIDLSGEYGVDFSRLFGVRDKDGNNLLMELAKNMKDDALRELLTNANTSNNVTHSILVTKNALGQVKYLKLVWFVLAVGAWGLDGLHWPSGLG